MSMFLYEKLNDVHFDDDAMNVYLHAFYVNVDIVHVHDYVPDYDYVVHGHEN